MSKGRGKDVCNVQTEYMIMIHGDYGVNDTKVSHVAN